MNTLLRIAKNTAAMAFENIVTKFLSLAFVVYVARKLGDDGFGRYSTAMALVGLLSVLPNYLARPYLIRETARGRERVRTLLTQVTLSNVVLSLLVFAGLTLATPYLGYAPETVTAILILGFALVFDSTTASYHAVLAGFERMELSALVNIFNTLLTVAIGGTLLALDYGLVSLIAAYAIAKGLTLLLALALLASVKAQPGGRIDCRLMARLFQGAWPFFVTSLFVMLYARLDIVMLSFMRGESEVGYYNAAYKVMEGLGLLSASFVTAVYPVLSRLFVDDRDRLLQVFRQAFRLLLAFVLPATAGLVVTAPDLMPALFGEEFLPAAWALMILVWGQALDSVNPLLSQTLRATDRERSVAGITGLGALFNIVANFLLIPPYGLYGASVATVASFLLVLIINLVVLRRTVGPAAVTGPLVRTVLATAIMAGVLLLLLRTVLNNFSVGARLGLTIAAGVVLYPLLALLFGVLNREDRQLLKGLLRRGTRRREKGSDAHPDDR